MAALADSRVTFKGEAEIVPQREHYDPLSSGSYDDCDSDDSDSVEYDGGRSKRKIFRSSESSIKALVWFVRLILMASCLACLVLSKLTLVKIIADLHNLGPYNGSNESTGSSPASNVEKQQAASLYWMLFFIVMAPNLISWIRTVLNGLLSKSPRRPWPKCSALLGCIMIAGMEAIAECFLVFYIFITFPPALSVLLMCGVYSTQSLVETVYGIYYMFCKTRGNRDNYASIDDGAAVIHIGKSIPHRCLIVTLLLIGFLCQASGIGSVSFFLVKAYTDSKAQILGLVLAVPCLIGLSLTWSGRMQKKTFVPNQKSIDKAKVVMMKNREKELNTIARWKASFIAISVRLVTYPFASYCIFRFMYTLQGNSKVDPWAVTHSISISNAFNWDSFYISVFLVHIISSFLAYVISWLACYMTLHVFGLAIPVLLATPISLCIYFISNSPFSIEKYNIVLFPFQESDISYLEWKKTFFTNWHYYAFGFGILLWIGQVLVASVNLFRFKNAILASDEDMFVRPYYNSVLLEQSLAINRVVSHKPQVLTDGRREPCRVFVCSTMFRENATEMRQMLRSIRRIARFFKKNYHTDQYESHIFFDGGCREDDLSQFAIQLMSLLKDTLNVKLKNATKQKTPYGYRFMWLIENSMPFMVHLKDNHKVRNKKRWSQVMYMKYILEHLYDKESATIDLNNTFILTTDADIDFKAESALVLLDMLARDPQVGAVCSRTHPLGSGPLYWYQVFDYAIGHWLQKSAEHVLGSVLCCPGCFSMFRCSALKQCLETYSSEVTNAMEFLTKDMGEDRWLCTLLVEQSWRLEFCAISNDRTYCPVSFDEFYKQRRRWIPSTVANIWLLISKAGKVTRRNESVTWAFILYQIIVIISTIISPATVILVISSGLSSSFGFNGTAIVVTFSLVAVLYGVICIFTSQKTQLDIAKLLTFVFSLVMATVAVGIAKETIGDILAPFEVVNKTSSDIDYHVTNEKGKLPVAESTIYISIFAFVFVITAILHFFEAFALFHFLWYILGLPSGYLLLLIYSVANLNDRRWGTREAADKSEQSLLVLLQQNVKRLVMKILKKTPENKEVKKEFEFKKENQKEDQKNDYVCEEQMGIEEPEMVLQKKFLWLDNWLTNNESAIFYDNFAKEGYTEEWCVAKMSIKDLESIGVRPIGYIHHLDKAIKKLPQTFLEPMLPRSVEEWIGYLKMDIPEEGYIQKFHAAGYYGEGDVENLVHITENELKNDIGVKKKAHVKRFMEGIQRLRIRDEDEEKMAEARMILELTNDHPNKPLDDEEFKFWERMVNTVLKPIPENLTQANQLRSDLKFLRNYALIAMLLINMMWLILLSIFTFRELQDIGLSANILGLLFLAVYGILIMIQFLGMIVHRVVTLSHYIARLNQNLPIEHTETVALKSTVFNR